MEKVEYVCETSSWPETFRMELALCHLDFQRLVTNGKCLGPITVSDHSMGTLLDNIFCFVIGNKNGKFAYMEASQRKQGDNVRLLSPRIQGENCLSLMYHMYGGSMGSLIIYLNTSSNETVEWIKSGNHPDQWFEAAVFFNTSVEYQVIFFSIPFQWNEKLKCH